MGVTRAAPAIFVLGALLSASAGCSRRSSDPPAAAKSVAPAIPAAPFAVPAPREPPSRLADVDLTQQDPDTLLANASAAARQRQWDAAVALQHWAVAKGAPGEYDLSCYYARAGLADPAIYWLQRAALEDGVDPDWAGKDADLEILRGDPRWSKLRPFLDGAREYWAGRPIKETLVAVPAGYAKGAPIPVVVALHGMGSGPGDFGGAWAQEQADALGAAFVSVSGTLPLGPRRFRWTESVERDAARIDEALATAGEQVTIAPGKIVLIGFSQGAQMSAEIAARDPSRFAGAIAMSPGTLSGKGSLDAARDGADLQKQRFVVVAGEREHPLTVATARREVERLRARGADVFDKIYEGVNRHALPPDFGVAMPVWIRFVLGSGSKPPRTSP